MKRVNLGVLTAIFAMGFGLIATAPITALASQGNIGPYVNAAPVQVAQSGGMPPADYGSPPSGEYPILFNDHHVYAKPDILNQNRVLAALVRGTTVLVPLRSMFEQMGATVSYDPESKTVDISKPGSDIKVTVGQKEVVINGESRPLDVPPEIYKGQVLVPVRVISEGMGAYVLWVPAKKTVVVRYVPPPPPTARPATPAPTRPPTPRPTVAPTRPPTPRPAPTPVPLPPETPTPEPTVYEKFIVADWLPFSTKTQNEFVQGNRTSTSYEVRGAIEMPFINQTFMVEADWRHWDWQHPANQPAPAPGGSFVCPNPVGTVGCTTVPGGLTQAYVPSFRGYNDNIDARVGWRVSPPSRIYLAGSYLWGRNNYGYPNLNGLGFGAEALPNLDRPSSLYGSYYYYPSISGNYGAFTVGGVTTPGGTLSYRVQRWQVGYDWNIMGAKKPLFLDTGFQGEGWINKTNAPSNINNYGMYVGLGLHF